MNVRNTAFAAALAGAATLGMSGGAGAVPLGSALPAPDTRAIAGAAAATEGGTILQAGFRGRRHHRRQFGGHRRGFDGNRRGFDGNRRGFGGHRRGFGNGAFYGLAFGLPLALALGASHYDPPPRYYYPPAYYSPPAPPAYYYRPAPPAWRWDGRGWVCDYVDAYGRRACR